MNQTRVRIVAVFLAACLAATIGAIAGPAGGASSPPAPVVWPAKEWKTATPESQGIDGRVLQRLDEAIARGEHGYLDGLLVVRHGILVFEKSYTQDYDRLFATAPDKTRGMYGYYDPDWHPFYRRGPLHTMQSVSKSVTSALVGIAIRRGEIPGAGVPALPYFNGYAIDADPRRARLTLAHLLTMTPGIRWNEDDYTDPANSCIRMEASPDWVRFVLDQPMAAEPGGTFVYNGGATELLAQALRKATGKDLDAYAARHLFGPIGIRNFYWKRTPTGLADAEGGLYLIPRDLARLGYLYLKGGIWNGKRILPEGWVASSTRTQVHVAPGEQAWGYGYQWWVIPAGGSEAYAALGYGDQLLFVVPSLDLIAVYTGWNVYDKPSLSPVKALDMILASVIRRT